MIKKLLPGICIKLRNRSNIQSIDWILSKWNDPNKAVDAVEARIGGSLEVFLDRSGVREINNRQIAYIAVKVVEDWSLGNSHDNYSMDSNI